MAKNYYYVISPKDLGHPVWGNYGYAADLIGGFCDDRYETLKDVKAAIERFKERLKKVRGYTQEKDLLEYNKEQVECIPDDDKLDDFIISILDLNRVKAGYKF